MISKSGSGKVLWSLLPLLAGLLLLVACADQEGGEPTAASVDQPTVVVATVAPTAGASTAQPTALPPTAAPTPTPTPPAPAVAVVNGQYILQADFERRVAQYEGALLAGGLDPTSEEGQADLAQIRADVLESLIDYVLVEQGAVALGVTLSDAELEAQIEADIAAGGGQASFDEWLQATGQIRDDYKAVLREAMLSQRVLEVVAGAVPEATEQVHARHIVVETEDEARQILAELQGGADFVALAREVSLDVATRDNGGDLGWFPRGLVALELERAAFALQPGQFSDVVALGEGYHIIQVVEREAARALSPEVQIDLRLALFDQWLAEQQAAANIVRFVGE